MSEVSKNVCKNPEEIRANAQIIRDMIKHENELVNQRVNWMLTIEGLLFTALAFAWEKAETHHLIPILCILGAIVTSATMINVGFSIKATARLVCLYLKYNDKTVTQLLPPVMGLDIGIDLDNPNCDGYCKYISPSTMMAFAFLIGWLWIYHVSPS